MRVYFHLEEVPFGNTWSDKKAVFYLILSKFELVPGKCIIISARHYSMMYSYIGQRLGQLPQNTFVYVVMYYVRVPSFHGLPLFR